MKKLLCFALVVSSALLFAPNRMSPLLLAKPAVTETAPEKLTADTSKTTVLGNTFVAPKDWTIRVKGDATILEAGEDRRRSSGGSVEGLQAQRKMAREGHQRPARPGRLEPSSRLRISDLAQRKAGSRRGGVVFGNELDGRNRRHG